MENISNQSEAPSLNTPTEFSNIEEFSINNASKLKILFNDKGFRFNVTKSSIPPKDYQLNLSLEQDLNSRVANLENYILILEERLKKLESILPEFNKLKKEKEEDLGKIFSGSDILNQEAKQMLLNWLPRKPNKITLLLNSNKDGDSTTSFLNKCNGKCPTLSVIKTINGYIFGGYTTQLWKEGQIKIQNAFVFSINKKKSIL